MKTHAQALCPAHWHHSNHKFIDCRDSISFGSQKFTPLPFLSLTSTLPQPGRSPQSLSWAAHTKPQRSGSSMGVHGSAGNSCPCQGTAVLPHTGHEILLGTAPYPQSWAGPRGTISTLPKRSGKQSREPICKTRVLQLNFLFK